MNFCKVCNFMLYKKLADEESNECESSGEPGKRHDCQLLEYCKNCGYENKIADDQISVYKRNYKNNFVVDKILNNKYIVFDNTLPRLNTECKNENCISKDSFNYLNENNSIIVNNIPENIPDSSVKEILLGFNFGTVSNEDSDNADYIKTINGFQLKFKRIKLCSLVIYYSHPKMSTASTLKKLQPINNNLKSYLENYDVETKFEQKETFLVSPYKKIDKEVLFVKYDPENMKYLYICVNCGVSW